LLPELDGGLETDRDVERIVLGPELEAARGLEEDQRQGEKEDGFPGHWDSLSREWTSATIRGSSGSTTQNAGHLFAA
jgi:hypothetical protein